MQCSFQRIFKEKKEEKNVNVTLWLQAAFHYMTCCNMTAVLPHRNAEQKLIAAVMNVTSLPCIPTLPVKISINMFLKYIFKTLKAHGDIVKHLCA